MQTSISLHKLYIFGSMTIVGIILFFFAQDVIIAPGLIIGGLIAFITEASTPLTKFLNRWKEINEIESAGVRHGDIISKKVIQWLDGSKQVDFMGNILSDVFEGPVGRALKEELNRREDKLLEIRVCIYEPSPENHFLLHRAEDEYEDVNSTLEDQIKHLVTYGTQVKEKLRKLESFKSLELRYVDSTYILNSIIRIDNRMIILDYLHRSGSGTPFYVLKEGEIFNIYKKEFDVIWKKSHKVDLEKL